MSRAGGAVSGSAQCHTAFQHDAVCPGGRADNAWVLPGGQPQQQVQTGRLALRPYPWQVCAERGEQTVAAGPVDAASHSLLAVPRRKWRARPPLSMKRARVSCPSASAS